MAGTTADLNEDIINSCLFRMVNEDQEYAGYLTNEARKQGIIIARARKLDPIVDAIFAFKSSKHGYPKSELHKEVGDELLSQLFQLFHIKQRAKICWPGVCKFILEKTTTILRKLFPMPGNTNGASLVLNWLVSYFDSVVPSWEENMEGLTINEWIEKQGGWDDLLNNVQKKESCICKITKQYNFGDVCVECNYCCGAFSS